MFIEVKPTMSPKESKTLQKQRQEFMLSTKFQAGMDENGGINARPVGYSDNDYKKCLDVSADQRLDSIQNKDLIERQNFKIWPEMPHPNSKS